ncbi:MAG: hypothetical protein H9536_04415 [Aphanizomenon flos-aquae Clear-A1]|nr:hypothetical protein [Aphanizomenon flos-aquae Clear-A1]
MRSASVVAIAFGVWECDRCLGLGVRSLFGMLGVRSLFRILGVRSMLGERSLLDFGSAIAVGVWECDRCLGMWGCD